MHHRTHFENTRQRMLAACGAGLLALALTGSAWADEGAVDYRHHTMEAVGGHMQAIADILKGKVPHQSHLGTHADALAALAELTPTLWPEGSEGGETLPEAFSDRDGLNEKIDDFRAAATAFSGAVSEGGDIGSAMRNLGQACKSCHDSYREE